MATHGTSLVDSDLLATKKAMWATFLKFSTYSIVGISVLLIGMAVFLL